LAAAAILAAGGVLYTVWRWHRPKPTPWIKPETEELDDPVLGRCVVSLPVIGQNQSKGFVECYCQIDGQRCEFRDSFIDETGGTEGMNDAIGRLRRYRSFATDRERMKIYRNSLAELTAIHNTLFPDELLDEGTLKRTFRTFRSRYLATQGRLACRGWPR
jgi:hypothetical protein